MKQIELSPAHKETLLASLTTSNGNIQIEKNNNIKISLINNGKVFAIPENFNISQYTEELNTYVATTLKQKTKTETLQDINIVEFYKTFSPISKKAIVYFINSKYLYINIVPYKFIENANYTESKISELLTSTTTQQIFQFTDNYITTTYPEPIQSTINTQGRYFETMELGIKPLLAYHLNQSEKLLAKLNIYKIEQSKANALTSTAEKSFYILTTEGAYLFCLDQNLNLKYAEDLSKQPMEVKSRIGRDIITCGTTSWITNRDNDFLYDEIKKLNNNDKNEKIKYLAILNLNHATNNEETLLAAQLLLEYAQNTNDQFFIFAAQFLVMKATYHSFDDVDDEQTLKLIALIDNALADNDLYQKTLQLINDFKLETADIAVLMHIFNRAKLEQQQYEQFSKTIIALKEKYTKLDNDPINTALIEIETARKLLSTGNRKNAEKIAESVLNRITDESTIYLTPNNNHSLSNKYSGAFINALAYDILFNATSDPELSEKYLTLRTCAKPLSDNISKLISIANTQNLKQRAEEVNILSETEKFATTEIHVNKREIKKNISRVSENLLNHPAMNKKMPFYDIKTWIDNVKPETYDSITNFGELATEANYPTLIETLEYCAKFFDIKAPKIYVFKGEKNIGILSYYSEEPFITVGYSHLDINSEHYLSPNELYFAIARQIANIKNQFAKLESNKLWRDFYNSGAMNIDKIVNYIPTPNFISKNISYYDKYQFASKIYSEYPQIDNLTNTDKQIVVSLEKKLSILHYKASTPNDIKINEYAAVSRIMCHYADRIGLLFAGNIITATNAIIKTEIDIDNILEQTKTKSIFDIINEQDNNGKLIHLDFALRIEALIRFYLSDNYTTLEKQIFG